MIAQALTTVCSAARLTNLLVTTFIGIPAALPGGVVVKVRAIRGTGARTVPLVSGSEEAMRDLGHRGGAENRVVRRTGDDRQAVL